jgi:hypothetical protein
MDFYQIENKYIDKIIQAGSILLLPVDDAIDLINDCEQNGLDLAGVEAFKLFDGGGIQPSMEFSNISFGKTEIVDGKIHLAEFKRTLRSGWEQKRNLFEETRILMKAGAQDGYKWFEVTINDPNSDGLMFFDYYDSQ